MSALLTAGPRARPLWCQGPGTLTSNRPAARASRLQIVAAKKKEPARTLLRIKLKSFTLDPLDASVYQILKCAEDAQVSGPVSLPRKIKKFTVLRSPHVNKDSREQFEIRTHSRLVDVIDPPPKIIDELMQLDMPAGVNVEVKLM